MKRLHVHVHVKDLDESIGFYSHLFAAQPSIAKPDYAKWMLDDPRVNFAISARGAAPGLDHLGIQAEDKNELYEIYGRLEQAGRKVSKQGETTCCYAKSEKSWVQDPAGISWETFHTFGESTTYGGGAVEPASPEHAQITLGGCCPAAQTAASNSPAPNIAPACC